MSGTIIDILSWALIILGSFALITGAVGVLRFPDVYTRMHAASITDTLGAGSIILGLVLQAGFTLVAAKLLLILVFPVFHQPSLQLCSGSCRPKQWSRTHPGCRSAER